MNFDEKSHGTLIPEKYTILIVDDNPQNLKALEAYLRAQGFKTLIASKGELALQRVQYVRPDLILLDILMPGIDGFETCCRLKADTSTKDIPVIFMTALSETDDKLRGFQVGGVDYLTKPIQQEEVLARIYTHLSIQGLQRQLREQNEQLKERTSALIRANEQLRYEITERKKAEETLREAQEEIIKLEKEALEIQMAGGFAHEMRNALTGIHLVLNAAMHDGKTLCQKTAEMLGHVFDLLEHIIPEKHRDNVIGMFKMIEKNEHTLDNILRMVHQYTTQALEVTTLILDYARLGKVSAGNESINLQQVVERLVQKYHDYFADEGISLRIHGTVERSLIGHDAHFSTIIENLVLNARDALADVTDDRERCIKIFLQEREQTQTVKIQDTANGISEELRTKIFEPFFSENPTRGVGLGLNFVYKLVSLYHGTIDVESEMGKGTIFTIAFPLRHS